VLQQAARKNSQASLSQDFTFSVARSWCYYEKLMKKGINKKIVIFHLFAQKPPIDGFAPNLAQP